MADKALHAVSFDGTTFGMEIEANTQVYRNFKKSVKREKAIGRFGYEISVMTVPYLFLAAIMREAHWMVSERKLFNTIRIDGFMESDIYVKYSDEIIDFRNRRADNA